LTVEAPPVSFPTIAEDAADAEGFVPKGWVLIDRKSGDLNKDGRPDIALLLRMDDKVNVVAMPYGEPGETWDTNPFMLAVAFADPAGGYRLAASSHSIFYRPDAPGSGDTLPNHDTLAIERGSLVVFYEHLRSHESFRFRWDGERLQLIGYDSGGAFSECVETATINYLTGKAQLKAMRIDSDAVRSKNYTFEPASMPDLATFDLGDFIPTDLLKGDSPPCPV